MKCKALVDVNVFQDVITKRKGWEESQKVLKLFEGDDYEGWISSLTRPIIYFLSVKRIKEAAARELVVDMTRQFAEIPLRYVINRKALENKLPEYEDNIQFESACRFHLDAIITRNIKHYKQEDMAIYTPDEFLNLIDGKDSDEELSVPFLDLKAQHHQIYNEVDDRITDVITNTAFIMGKHVREFEERFAELQEARYCVGVSSGTDALHVALLALGIGPGDRVVVPVNTFIATAEAVSLCGAEPVFVDCDEFYNMNVQKLRKVIDSQKAEENVSRKGAKALRREEGEKVRGQRAEVWKGQKIRREEGEKVRGQKSATAKQGLITNNDSRITCILPVHLYGQPANMDGIMALAEEYGLKVVEDACQAHLGKYKGRKVGNFGKFGCFSFYPGKNLGAYGEAGAVVTNDEELYQKMKLIHDHGASVRYHHDLVGHNYRMEAFQGAVLCVKLKHIEKWTEKRQENAALYNELLNDVEEVIAPEIKKGRSHSFHLYVVRCQRRDELKEYLEKQGIATGLHYPVPLHLQKAYAHLGYKKGDFPVAEGYADEILSLPMYPELTEGQIRYVCDKISEFMRNKN